jgi:hypothetical protein
LLGIGAISKIKAASYHQPLFEFEVHQRPNAAMADDVVAFTKANLPADSMVEAERVAAAIRTRAEIKARLMPQLDKALK